MSQNFMSKNNLSREEEVVLEKYYETSEAFNYVNLGLENPDLIYVFNSSPYKVKDALFALYKSKFLDIPTTSMNEILSKIVQNAKSPQDLLPFGILLRNSEFNKQAQQNKNSYINSSSEIIKLLNELLSTENSENNLSKAFYLDKINLLSSMIYNDSYYSISAIDMYAQNILEKLPLLDRRDPSSDEYLVFLEVLKTQNLRAWNYYLNKGLKPGYGLITKLIQSVKDCKNNRLFYSVLLKLYLENGNSLDKIQYEDLCKSSSLLSNFVLGKNPKDRDESTRWSNECGNKNPNASPYLKSLGLSLGNKGDKQEVCAKLQQISISDPEKVKIDNTSTCRAPSDNTPYTFSDFLVVQFDDDKGNNWCLLPPVWNEILENKGKFKVGSSEIVVPVDYQNKIRYNKDILMRNAPWLLNESISISDSLQELQGKNSAAFEDLEYKSIRSMFEIYTDKKGFKQLYNRLDLDKNFKVDTLFTLLNRLGKKIEIPAEINDQIALRIFYSHFLKDVEGRDAEQLFKILSDILKIK